MILEDYEYRVQIRSRRYVVPSGQARRRIVFFAPILQKTFAPAQWNVQRIEVSCPADLDGDGNIGVGDLLALLGQWGTDPRRPPDFDGNGNVGVSDLLVLLANWGPCP